MAEQRRDWVSGEDICAGFVDEAHVDVHAGTRPFMMGFGHEGCFHAVGVSGGTHGTLQQQAIECRGGGIGLVLQVDFELAGARLLNDGIDRKVLCGGDGVHVVDEGADRIEFAVLVELREIRRVSKTLGGLQFKVPGFRFHSDVELEFYGADG